jgi:CelD/BcsL family acetyltransferase involved in cellulose biosynthesis
VVHLAGSSFDDWFMSKTTHFRQRMRKARKEFLKRGGRFRLSTAADFEEDIQAFVRVHRARWQERGGSLALTPGVEEILLAAGRRLIPSGRFRLWSLELGGEVISSHILVRAGSELGYWLTGWVPTQAVGSSSLIGILNAIEDGFAIGAERIQLGEGGFAYKYRFATGEDELRWSSLVPPGSRSAIAHLRLLGPRTRRLAGHRLPEPVKDRLRRL